MIDMKLSDMDKREEAQEMKSVLSGPSYPYGLKITLRPEEMKKLMMETPQVGNTFEFCVKAVVTNVDMYEGKGEEVSCSLQITDMEIEEKDDKVANNSIFGD